MVSKHFGIRTIAWFELVKGVGAIIVAAGIFDLIKERKIFILGDFISHAQPPAFKKFLEYSLSKIEMINTHQAKFLLAFGIMYAGLRLVEGYGLYKERNWGRYVGIWSALLYLPFEFYEIAQDFSVMKIIITVINILVVIYLWNTNLSLEAQQ